MEIDLYSALYITQCYEKQKEEKDEINTLTDDTII